jgi:hypothetical protein
MKRAKLVQLLNKDDKGLYKKDGQNEILRSGVKVPDSMIAQYENDYPETGRLYIVIEEEKKTVAKQPKAQKEEQKED